MQIIVNKHVGPFFGEAQCDAPSDAPARARDKGNLSFQTFHLQHTP